MDASINTANTGRRARRTFDDLNVYVAIVLLISSAMSLIMTPAVMVISLFFASIWFEHSPITGLVLVALIGSMPIIFIVFSIPFFWVFKGLAPRNRKYERERYYSLGQWILLVSNSISLVSGVVMLCLLLAVVFGSQVYSFDSPWLVLLKPIFGFPTVGLPLGLLLIWSSRAKPEDA